MVGEERTNQRASDYSHWHRTLPNLCYMIDFDSVEWRSDRGIVAVIETAYRYETQTLTQQLETKKFEIKVLSEVSKTTNWKCYIVFHNENLTTFWIFQIINDQAKWWQTIGPNEYSLFIQNL